MPISPKPISIVAANQIEMRLTPQTPPTRRLYVAVAVAGEEKNRL